MDQQLAAYLVFTTLLVLTPGSATAVVVRNVLDGGRRQGMAAAVGAAAGNTTYATLSALGLAAVFARVPTALLLLRIGGTVYLAWLGVKSLSGAWRRDPASLPGGLERNGTRPASQLRSGQAPRPRSAQPAAAATTGFTQGLATNLVNPAVATFYLTVVPSFLTDPTTLSSRYLVYAVLHITMAFTYHSGWVWALHAMRTFWSRPNARRALETLTGLALIALAARVAGAL